MTGQPAKPAEFGMYLDGRWYRLSSTPSASPATTRSAGST